MELGVRAPTYELRTQFSPSQLSIGYISEEGLGQAEFSFVLVSVTKQERLSNQFRQ